MLVFDISRYFWLSAQMEQKMMRLKTSSEMYEKCKLYCQVLKTPLASASPFESSISFDVIDYRICMLEARHFIVDVDTLFKRGDKSTTWLQLAPVFLPTLANLNDTTLVKKFSIARDFVFAECDLNRRLVLLEYLYEVKRNLLFSINCSPAPLISRGGHVLLSGLWILFVI